MPYKIVIRGYIGWDENATPDFLEKELKAANGDELAVEFSSGGGSVFAGLEMANMLRNYTGRVVAKITGLAASMSSYIPMMADELIVEDNAVFMIHNVSTFAWGDFRDLEKTAKHIRGLRDILAKAYVGKTSKSLSDIQGLMDDESFFYGDEIVEAGFADSVIQVSDDGDDKDTAVALAQEDIKNCVAVMKDNEAKFADDFERAAAFINKEVPKTPAAAGKPKEEAVSMKSLKEFLAATPDAQAEYDVAIKAAADTARTEGEATGIEKGSKEGVEQMKAMNAVIMPIISSSHYPDAVKTRVTEKAQAGDIEAVKDYVSMYDMTAEGVATAKAIEEAGKETPPEAPEAGLSTDGMINNPADLQAAAAQHKAEYGTDGGTK